MGSSKISTSDRLKIEKESPTHLVHGKMTPGMFERRESSGSGSSLIAGGAEDRKRPFMIGVAGGTASGKSTVCEKIRKLVVSEDAQNARQIITCLRTAFT